MLISIYDIGRYLLSVSTVSIWLYLLYSVLRWVRLFFIILVNMFSRWLSIWTLEFFIWWSLLMWCEALIKIDFVAPSQGGQFYYFLYFLNSHNFLYLSFPSIRMIRIADYSFWVRSQVHTALRNTRYYTRRYLL